ncbi:MAG TPA: hypothetical protein DEP51_07510 [Clostridiales bacterium]|nr:hypothetical protein [Clostridiales bacterium]
MDYYYWTVIVLLIGVLILIGFVIIDKLNELVSVRKEQTDLLYVLQADLCTLIEISRQEKSDK